MILLDTNVISAVMLPAPPAAVVAWLNRQPARALFLTVITLAEIGYGIALLPDGRRRRDLTNRFEQYVGEGFAGRVVPFDEAAARVYGTLMAARRHLGQPMATLDGQIAAIASARGWVLATRNIRDFADCGLDLVDPFAAA